MPFKSSLARKQKSEGLSCSAEKFPSHIKDKALRLLPATDDVNVSIKVGQIVRFDPFHSSQHRHLFVFRKMGMRKMICVPASR